jgi:hypothetical protein
VPGGEKVAVAPADDSVRLVAQVCSNHLVGQDRAARQGDPIPIDGEVRVSGVVPEPIWLGAPAGRGPMTSIRVGIKIRRRRRNIR